MKLWTIDYCEKVTGERAPALQKGDNITTTIEVASKNITIDRGTVPIIPKSTLTGGVDNLSFDCRQHGYTGEIRYIALPTQHGGVAQVLMGFLGFSDKNDPGAEENEDTEVFVATKSPGSESPGPPERP